VKLPEIIGALSTKEHHRRAVAYLRVSTQGQAERGMSLQSQRERVTEYARTKGWKLLDVVEEAASGGVKSGEEFSWQHRPGLLRILDRAERGELDVLLVAKLDRLSRDYATLTVLERRLQRHEVDVVSTAEENGDGPIAEFIRGQLALVAELERAMILERVSAGKAKKKQLGRHVHGRVPFAYTSEHGVLTPDPERASTVRRIFEEAKDGYTPGKIARGLNADLTPSPQGAQWSAKAVRRVLANPVYAGERYGVKRAHPAIVSRQLYNAVNRAGPR
jgi:site-specific DNA recombinase